MTKKKEHKLVNNVLPFRSAYSGQKKVQFETTGECKVMQSHKDYCDINRIVKQYIKDGSVENVTRTPAQYGDFSNIGDFQTALERVQQAQEAFEELPSAIRKKYDNDPGKLLEAIDDPSRHPELIKLGVINEVAVETPPDGVQATSHPETGGKNLDMLSEENSG